MNNVFFPYKWRNIYSIVLTSRFEAHNHRAATWMNLAVVLRPKLEPEPILLTGQQGGRARLALKGSKEPESGAG